MTTRIQKNEVAKRIASRLSIDEKLSEEYLDAVLETLYEAFKSGESVTPVSYTHLTLPTTPYV